MKRLSFAFASVCLFALAAAVLSPVGLTNSASAQGVLIVIDHPHPMPLPRPWPRPRPLPEPPAQMTYKIKEISVDARVVDQVAKVQVSQSFVNTGNRQMEVQFVFPIPYDSAIDQLTLMVDGKEFPGKLLPAKEARSIYESYIRKNQDPALLEFVGTGMFKTSVFPVPPGAERKVSLRYNQLLRKDHGLTDFMLPLAAAKYTSAPVESINVNVSIESTQEIKNVYSPTHPIDIKREGATKNATVKYSAKNEVPSGDFRLFYDVGAGKVGASLLSYRPDDKSDGYFVLLASPEIKSDKSPQSKTVIMVIDRSGSMSGKKIEQARDALKFVINNLRDGDLFNIVAYDTNVESFKPELQKMNDEMRKLALGYAEGIQAGGSTNIDGALTTALGMLQDDKRPNYVIFLTDGLPTQGETNEMKIVENTKKNNKHRVRLVSFGVGYDLNSRLLDRLSRVNHGQSEFVRPNENIEASVARLYAKIASPVMTDVSIKFDMDTKPEEGPVVNRLMPGTVTDLFAGEQLVIVGRYKKPGEAKITVTGKVNGEEKKYDFSATFVAKSMESSYAFAEKLWAMRRIGEIIDQMDLSGKNEELVKELVALSIKHGIVTPYTSFIADDQAKPGDLSAVEFNYRRAEKSVDRLAESDGRSGVAQRGFKKDLQSAAAPQSAAPRVSSGAFSGEGKQLAGPGGGRGNVYRDIDTDKEVAADSVQQVGNETLYKRGKQWIAANASDVDLEKEKASIVDLKRFSDEYFKVIAENTASENAVLASQQTGEELIIKLRGKVYRIQ